MSRDEGFPGARTSRPHPEAMPMCKPNMVYTSTPQRRGNPCGCPVIPGLGAHKGRPYGCVQDDDSDQANITPR